MNRKKLLVGHVSLLVMLLITTNAAAQTSTRFDLSWFALAGGGARATSTSYAMISTLGQWAISSAEAANQAVNSGYWQSWQDQTICLPLVLR